jgi:hypothetical protein
MTLECNVLRGHVLTDGRAAEHERHPFFASTCRAPFTQLGAQRCCGQRTAVLLGFSRELLVGSHGRGDGPQGGDERRHVDVALHVPEALRASAMPRATQRRIMASSFQRLTLRATRQS